MCVLTASQQAMESSQPSAAVKEEGGESALPDVTISLEGGVREEQHKPARPGRLPFLSEVISRGKQQQQHSPGGLGE